METADAKEIPPEIEWVELEKKFCCRDNEYRPTTKVPSIKQLKRAAKEFRRRFMCADGEDSGVPGVLVATEVDQAKWRRSEQTMGCKFLLTAAGDLFMISVPSPVHQTVLDKTQFMSSTWLSTLGFPVLMNSATNRRGEGMEPDITIRPLLPWDAADSPNSRPRVMIEVEYKHRGPHASRQWGLQFLTRSHFSRAFVLIKVYPRDAAGNFAAAAFVWRQGPVEVPPGPLGLAPAGPVPMAPTLAAPVTPAQIAQQALAAAPIGNAAAALPLIGAPVFHQAVEFGTMALSASRRNGFVRFAAAGLPPAVPFPAYGGPAAAVNIQIPAGDVFYLCRDGPGNVLWLPPAAVPVGNDLVIDLGHIRYCLQLMPSFDVSV